MIKGECDVCGQKFEAYTEGQLNNQLGVHKMSKHKEVSQ